MIFFTSDWHINHQNVMAYCNRPFKDLQEMEETLIANWNNVVQDNDRVYVLGDFSLNTKHAIRLAPLLKGEKTLIMGNHDGPFKGKKKDKIREQYIDAGWYDCVYEYRNLVIGNHHVDLSHFPYAPKQEDKYNNDVRYLNYRLPNSNKTLLHGHSHNRYLKNNNMIDVGIDNDFQLLSQDRIIQLIEDERKFIPSRLTEWYETEAYKKTNEEVRNK